MWVHFCECQSVFCVRALSECDKERPFCVNARAFCVNARSFNWTRESFMWMFCENASVLWENESIVCDCKYNIFECECSCGMRVRLWNASMVHGDVSMFCWDASACVHVKKKIREERNARAFFVEGESFVRIWPLLIERERVDVGVRDDFVGTRAFRGTFHTKAFFFVCVQMRERCAFLWERELVLWESEEVKRS